MGAGLGRRLCICSSTPSRRLPLCHLPHSPPMSVVSPLHVQPSAPPSEGMQASLQRHLQRVRVLRPGLHLHADEDVAKRLMF